MAVSGMQEGACEASRASVAGDRNESSSATRNGEAEVVETASHLGSDLKG